MSVFTERVKKNKQVMVACLIPIETKTELDRVAKATRRSKSGCIDIALQQWLHQERKRIAGSVEEVTA